MWGGALAVREGGEAALVDSGMMRRGRRREGARHYEDACSRGAVGRWLGGCDPLPPPLSLPSLTCKGPR